MLIRHHNEPQAEPTAAALIEMVGFSHPTQHDPAHERRSRAFTGLITTTALAVSLTIAVVAVSVGIARANLPAAPTALCCVE